MFVLMCLQDNNLDLSRLIHVVGLKSDWSQRATCDFFKVYVLLHRFDSLLKVVEITKKFRKIIIYTPILIFQLTTKQIKNMTDYSLLLLLFDRGNAYFKRNYIGLGSAM